MKQFVKYGESPALDMQKVSTALSTRLPKFLGPWDYVKTTLGQSNPTFILSGKTDKLVLRRKPDGKLLKSAHMVDREYQVMKSLYPTLVPVPKVYYLCNNPSEIGAVYFVMEFVNGVAFAVPELLSLSFEQRKRIYDEMNLGLVTLHKINPDVVGLTGYGKPGNYFKRQLSVWSKQFELSHTESIIEMEILKDWLKKNVPEEIVPSRLVHGDWRIDNLIFSNTDYSLKAILDWELSTLGDPRADLANQLMQWSMPLGKEGRGLLGVDRTKLGIPEDQEYIDLYSKRMGLTQAPDLEFAMALSFFKMGAILQGIKKRAINGNASNSEKGIALGKYVKVCAKSALNYLKI